MAKLAKMSKRERLHELLGALGDGRIDVETYRKLMKQHGLRDDGERDDDVDLYLRGDLR